MSKIYKKTQVTVGTPIEIQIPDNIDIFDNDTEEMLPEEGQLSESMNEEPEKEIISPEEKKRMEAEKIINEANVKALEIIQAAEFTAASIQEDAKKKGYEEGYAIGYTEGKEKFEKMISEAEYMQQKAVSDYEEIMKNMEPDIIDLVMDIAAKILGSEIRADKQKMVAMIAQAVKKSGHTENVIVRVSPEDHEFLHNNINKLIELCGSDSIEIKKDSSVKRGGCVIESQFGSIEAGLDTQLEQIGIAFREMNR